MDTVDGAVVLCCFTIQFTMYCAYCLLCRYTVLFYYDDGTPVVENGVQRSVSYDARGVHEVMLRKPSWVV